MAEPLNALQHKVALSADDYGLAPGIGFAIRDLAVAGRLNATSCMTTGPHWPAEAALLRAVAPPVFEVGLHLVLTDQPCITKMPLLAPDGRLPALPALIKQAMRGRLETAEITAEVQAQLDCFEAAWGRPPDFLDGHHHVHQLPMIRDIVLAAYSARLANHGAWLRRCTQPLSAIVRSRSSVVRAIIISLLGVRFKALADRAGIPGNRCFAGVRGFAGEPPYDELMRRWLSGAGAGTLIMCHPGLVDDALIKADSLTTPREEEYRFLAGDAFPALLQELGVSLIAPSRL